MPRNVCSRKNETPMAQISGASPRTWRKGRYASLSVSTAMIVDVATATARIPTGTLIRKIGSQSRPSRLCWMSSPPISGPVTVADPAGVSVVKVEAARQMLAAVEQALPADVAVFAAAVADWRPQQARQSKIKKQGRPPTIELVENPDILSTIAHRKSGRPSLVIGFAAETDNVIANAKAKLVKKSCDWILANDVSPETGIMGGDSNTINLVTATGVESWPPQSKDDVARRLIERIAAALKDAKK